MSHWQRIEAPPRLPKSIEVPGSKSLSHRAILLAKRCSVPPQLTGLLWSADTEATHRGMDSLCQSTPIDCGNSGTSLRFLIGQAALLDQTTHFTGDASLARRDCQPLLTSLANAGVDVKSRSGRLPISIKGPLRAGEILVDPTLSSQFLSSLILALPFADGNSEVRLIRPPPSKAYVDLTVQTATAFGLRVDERSSGFFIQGHQSAENSSFSVEGDWSSAGLAAACALAAKQELRLTNLRNDSIQGDRRLIQIMEAFGVHCTWNDGVLLVRPTALRAAPVIDLRAQPDLLPPIAVLASLSPGTTRIQCSPGIHHKESDRIDVMKKALNTCGLQAKSQGHDLIVEGGRARFARVECAGDHRIHMALCALAATLPEGLILDSADSVDVSWPGFHQALGFQLSQ